MKIYGIYYASEGTVFCRNKRDAIAEAKATGGYSVTKYDIGKVDKAKVCALASGVGFAESSEVVWEESPSIKESAHDN